MIGFVDRALHVRLVADNLSFHVLRVQGLLSNFRRLTHHVCARDYCPSTVPPRPNNCEMEDLTSRLRAFGISRLTSYPNCNPESNPVDIYRSHITDHLAGITGVDTSIIYPAVQWPPSLDKGDLVLAVPALRIKSKKPTELAQDFASQVRYIPGVARASI